MIGGDLQAIDVRQCAERRRAWNEEIAKQSRIGPSGRRHPHEETIERLRFFGWRQEVEIIALAHRLRFSSTEYFSASDYQCRPRPSRDKPPPQVRAVRCHRITYDFTGKLPGQVELNAAW